MTNNKKSTFSIDSIIGGPIGTASKLGIKAGITLSGAVALEHSDGSYIQPSVAADGKITLAKVLEGMVIDAPAFILPVQASTLVKNDIILKDNDLIVVVGITEDGTIAGVSIERSEKIEVVPVTHQMIPGAFVRKLSSLLGTVGGAPSTSNPFAPQAGLGGQPNPMQNMLPLLMMNKGGKGNDNLTNMMMLSSLGGAAGGGLGNIAQNPMMLMALSGEGGLDLGGEGEGGLMHALMMQSVMGGIAAPANAPVVQPVAASAETAQVNALSKQVADLTSLVGDLVNTIGGKADTTVAKAGKKA